MRILLTHLSISLTYTPFQSVGNKTLHIPCRFLQSNVAGIDISTCRLWNAMLMTKCGDYRLSLRIVNTVLSNISIRVDIGVSVILTIKQKSGM